MDVWNGIITSTFRVEGKPVKVITQGDFDSDAVAFDIESDLVSSGILEVELDFPYPPIPTVDCKFEVFVSSYDFSTNHSTFVVESDYQDTAHIYHEMQETKYHVNLRWPGPVPLSLARDEPVGPVRKATHRHTLTPKAGRRRKKPSKISFTAHFSSEKQTPSLPRTIQSKNPCDWNDYWLDGGFVDLTGSSNPNATELQRRIVLSQYHVRVNSAAEGQPPQESGLMNNGWYGE